MKTEKQVLSYAPSSDKEGAWLKLKTLDDKGEARDMYIKKEDQKKLFTQPGFYEFELEKNGKYWEPTNIRFVRPLNGSGGTSSGNGNAARPTATPGVADVNVVIQNKAITAQVCVKAAAEIIGKAIESGAFKDKEGVTDLDSIIAISATMAREFMGEAREFFAGPKPTDKSYTDDAGRTHEKVEGA